MNAIQLVVEQHREIQELARAVLVAPRDERASVLQRLGDRLETHLDVEERVLYPMMRSHREATAIEAYLQDHHDLRMIWLRLTSAGFVEDPLFLDQAALAAATLREHMRDEEETHLLPPLAMSLSEPELEALGTEMLELYERLRRHQPFRRIVRDVGDRVFSRVG